MFLVPRLKRTVRKSTGLKLWACHFPSLGLGFPVFHRELASFDTFVDLPCASSVSVAQNLQVVLAKAESSLNS